MTDESRRKEVDFSECLNKCLDLGGREIDTHANGEPGGLRRSEGGTS